MNFNNTRLLETEGGMVKKTTENYDKIEIGSIIKRKLNFGGIYQTSET